ncbi:hypothetical protein Q5P01_018376 [Channa striata]|uniref:Uncharacterized protein n=1 Tax=Channa striata TaxID=64152 RepID=A0AA88M4N8_CHASR|nr:hypothetical protein Q5P01_018376 [Channa striata]
MMGCEEKVLKVTDEQNLGSRSPAAAVTAAIALTGLVSSSLKSEHMTVTHFPRAVSIPIKQRVIHEASGEGEGVQPNHMGSSRVHNFQVGLSSTRETFEGLCGV